MVFVFLGFITFFIAVIVFILALVFAIIALITYITYINDKEKRNCTIYLKYALVSFLISVAVSLVALALISIN